MEKYFFIILRFLFVIIVLQNASFFDFQYIYDKGYGPMILYLICFMIGITWAYYGTAYFFTSDDDYDDGIFKKPDE